MQFTLIGLPYDKTQTCRKGASKAPDMIRGIFPLLETYVYEIDLTEYFMDDLGNLSEKQLKNAKIKGFPIALGGEHTVTEWMVDKIKPKNVLIFDAHFDCEDSNKHDGVVRRIAEKGYNVYILGARCYSKKEKEYVEKSKINVIGFHDLPKIEGKTYVSIDLDVLDPSVMPTAGNPEPDGFSITDVIYSINAIKDIAGFDIVEFTPFEINNDVYLILVGKLVYSLMCVVAKREKNIIKS